MLNSMDNNRGAIQHECAMLSFYMQGGLSFNDAFILSADQRQSLGKVVKSHYEAMNGTKGKNMM